MNGICKNEVEYDMNMPENLKKTKEGKNKKALKLNVFKAFCCIFCGDGAHGGIWTPTPRGTWTWTMRVYQFRHVGNLHIWYYIWNRKNWTVANCIQFLLIRKCKTAIIAWYTNMSIILPNLLKKSMMKLLKCRLSTHFIKNSFEKISLFHPQPGRNSRNRAWSREGQQCQSDRAGIACQKNRDGRFVETAWRDGARRPAFVRCKRELQDR